MDADATRPVILTVEADGLRADLLTVDWLARLALLAQRQGGRMVVRGASVELRDLIDLSGLNDVLGPASPRLRALPPPERRREYQDPY